MSMGDSNENNSTVIRLRGLPWNSTAKDILEFLVDVSVAGGDTGIHMAINPRDGRPNGEAFVECATLEDVDKAFTYNKNILGHRYIESKIFLTRHLKFVFKILDIFSTL
jgi:RNA recognition motif-containing protein